MEQVIKTEAELALELQLAKVNLELMQLKAQIAKQTARNNKTPKTPKTPKIIQKGDTLHLKDGVRTIPPNFRKIDPDEKEILIENARTNKLIKAIEQQLIIHGLLSHEQRGAVHKLVSQYGKYNFSTDEI